jgi:hypothetical protein
MSEPEKSQSTEIIPTIAELRKRNYKVRVLHYRLLNGDLVANAARKIKKNYNKFLSPQRKIAGQYRSPKGGKTIIEILTPDGRSTTGTALCSPEDAFCRKSANKIAITRALANLKDTPLKPNV